MNIQKPYNSAGAFACVLSHGLPPAWPAPKHRARAAMQWCQCACSCTRRAPGTPLAKLGGWSAACDGGGHESCLRRALLCLGGMRPSSIGAGGRRVHTNLPRYLPPYSILNCTCVYIQTQPSWGMVSMRAMPGGMGAALAMLWCAWVVRGPCIRGVLTAEADGWRGCLHPNMCLYRHATHAHRPTQPSWAVVRMRYRGA